MYSFLPINKSAPTNIIEEVELLALCENIQTPIESIQKTLSDLDIVKNSTSHTNPLWFFYNYTIKNKNNDKLNEEEQKIIMSIFLELVKFYNKKKPTVSNQLSIGLSSDLKSNAPSTDSKLKMRSLNVLEASFLNIENIENLLFFQEMLLPYIKINDSFLLFLISQSLEDKLSNSKEKLYKTIERLKFHTSINSFLDPNFLAEIFLNNGRELKQDNNYSEDNTLELINFLINLNDAPQKIKERQNSSKAGLSLLALCLVNTKRKDILLALLPHLNYNLEDTKYQLHQYYRNYPMQQWSDPSNYLNSLSPDDVRAIVEKYKFNKLIPTSLSKSKLLKI